MLGRIEARAVEKQDKPRTRRRSAPQADRGRPDRAGAVRPARRRLPPARPARPRPGGPPAGPRPDRQRLPASAGADGTRPRAGPQEPRTRRGPHPASEGEAAAVQATTTARGDELDEELQRTRAATASGEAHQGDQRPRDRHLPGEGGPLPDRRWPPHRTRHAAAEGRPAWRRRSPNCSRRRRTRS